METTIKTPVEIVQEMLAIFSTRKEIVEKLKAKQPDENTTGLLTSADHQSDEFIAELMSELSNYGDAVMASVDRENEYQALWKTKSKNIDSFSPREAEETFLALEESLKKIYQDTIQSNPDLPESLSEILTRQLGKI